MPDDFKPPSPRLGHCASESELEPRERETKLERQMRREDEMDVDNDWDGHS